MALESGSIGRSHDKLKHNIFNTMMSMVTRVGRMMSYLERLLPVTSHDHSIMWSCEICCIATCARSVDTKHGHVVTCCDRLQRIKFSGLRHYGSEDILVLLCLRCSILVSICHLMWDDHVT